MSNCGVSGSPEVVNSQIGGGVLSPEISLQSCDTFSLSVLPKSNTICCLSSQEQAVICFVFFNNLLEYLTNILTEKAYGFETHLRDIFQVFAH